MAAPANHWKLGLFVIAGIGAAIAAIVFFGAATLRKETVHYHTYFNESVQGLEVGSPVKFRGVTIGYVQKIQIAPDHRLVDVVEELDVGEIKRLGLAETGHGRTGKPKFAIPPDLRAQLGSQGITGVKFVSIDFFDAKANPPPDLPFAPPDRYIPAAVSTLKNLEDTITKAMDRLPEMVDAVVHIMARVDRLLATLEREGVPEKIASAVANAKQARGTMKNALARNDRANVGEKAAAAIDELHVAVTKMNAVFDRLDGDKGLVASATRATEAFGQVGRDGRATQRDLESTLRDVSEAADAIRKLAESLDRDPDMLIKGRAKGKTSP